jgi:hypothetical protein
LAQKRSHVFGSKMQPRFWLRNATTLSLPNFWLKNAATFLAQKCSHVFGSETQTPIATQFLAQKRSHAAKAKKPPALCSTRQKTTHFVQSLHA